MISPAALTLCIIVTTQYPDGNNCRPGGPGPGSLDKCDICRHSHSLGYERLGKTHDRVSRWVFSRQMPTSVLDFRVPEREVLNACGRSRRAILSEIFRARSLG